MDREQRINMKFCFKLQKSAKETHEILKLIYDDAVTMKTVYKWFEWLWIGWRRGQIGTSFNIKNPREIRKSKRNDSIKQAIDY
jgi:hypothetical protein